MDDHKGGEGEGWVFPLMLFGAILSPLLPPWLGGLFFAATALFLVAALGLFLWALIVG
ncbi:MAG: hypothetical protein LBU39_08810 [Desulfobulbaceae bacterium]|jgi:hypothetical protein|nr:hypothetical protein [Desulfobulbaceae bacterium]